MPDNRNMSPIEVDSLISMVKGMSKEQLKIAVQYIPIEVMCEEISRRHNTLVEKLTGISSIMENL